MRASTHILLNGGYRDDVGIMGIAANELSLCRNFEPAAQGGIVKTGDFERFDGQPAPSKAGTPSDAIARRALIQTVPGEGRILGLGFYDGAVIAVRNVVGNSSCTMWRSTATGWQAIKSMLPPNGRYRFTVGNFYAGSNTLTLYGVSGTHQAFSWDGATFIYLHTGNPQFIAIFKNHLFLSLAGGRFVHSTVGDPTLYGAGASEFGLGAEITGFRLYKGGLIITTEKAIHTLFGSSKLDWQLDTFTDQIGAQADTMHDVVGDLFFFHKSQGFSFKATQEYGKFATDSITKKINNSLASVGVKFCLVSPARSAYLIQANDKRMFSMVKTPDGFDFGIRSYPFSANCGIVSPDGAVFIGTSSGFIYQIDVGYSADSAAIDNLVRTGFIAPSKGKKFRLHKLASIFSGQSSAYTLRVDCDFDESSGTPIAVPAPSGGALWDSAQWNGSIFDSYPAARVETYPSATAEAFAIMLTHSDLQPMRVLSFEFTLSLRGAKK